MASINDAWVGENIQEEAADNLFDCETWLGKAKRKKIAVNPDKDGFWSGILSGPGKSSKSCKWSFVIFA